MTKLLHKSGMPESELGQWESDQVGERLEWCMVATWAADKLGQEKAV